MRWAERCALPQPRPAWCRRGRAQGGRTRTGPRACRRTSGSARGHARAARGDVIRYTETVERPGSGEGRLDITLTPIKDENGRIIYIVPEAREMD